MTFRTRKRSTARRTSYESLEDRRMLAGNVRVAPIDGALFMRGDSMDNQVEMISSQDGTSSIIIRGLEGTTINGESEIRLEGTDAAVSQGLRANMGQGDDFLFLEKMTFGGQTNIYGSFGNDRIGTFDMQFNHLTVQTFSGDDVVSLDESVVDQELRVITLDGDDTVGFSSLTAFDTTLVSTGNGNDRFVADGMTARLGLRVLTFDGNDYIGVNQISTTTLRAFGGNGNDRIFIDRVSVAQPSAIGGQAGTDEYNIVGVSSQDKFTVSTFEDTFRGGRVITNNVFTELITTGTRLGTITELAVLTPELSTLVGALTATGLADVLNNSRGSYTAFAPTNDAFDALPPGTLESLTNEELTDILKYHVAEGEYFAERLVTFTDINTLLDETFSVEVVGGEVLLNGDVTLAATDIRAKNGVIHVLNAVLLP